MENAVFDHPAEIGTTVFIDGVIVIIDRFRKFQFGTDDAQETVGVSFRHRLRLLTIHNVIRQACDLLCMFGVGSYRSKRSNGCHLQSLLNDVDDVVADTRLCLRRRRTDVRCKGDLVAISYALVFERLDLEDVQSGACHFACLDRVD